MLKNLRARLWATPMPMPTPMPTPTPMPASELTLNASARLADQPVQIGSKASIFRHQTLAETFGLNLMTVFQQGGERCIPIPLSFSFLRCSIYTMWPKHYSHTCIQWNA